MKNLKFRFIFDDVHLDDVHLDDVHLDDVHLDKPLKRHPWSCHPVHPFDVHPFDVHPFDIKISTDDKGLSKELFALQNRLFENRQVRSLGTDPETGVMHYQVDSPFKKYFGVVV
jgi:hypothetical protein